MFSVRNILFVILGMHFFSTQLQMISGGYFGESSTNIKDDDINLDDILEENKGNQIKYYKYAMIVYCRAVESKMEISRGKISHLKELDEFDDSKRMLASFNTRYKNLINIALQVFNQYHAAIRELKEQNGLSYLQTAFYFRALRWLTYKMKIKKDENNSDYRQLAEAVENNLQSDVAKNYLPDILSPENFRATGNSFNQYASTILKLKNIAKDEDAAVDLFLKIKSEGFEATALVNREDIVKCSYEDILGAAIPENFKAKFNSEPHIMLMYADYVYFMKNAKLGNTKEVFDNDLKISDTFKDGVAGWKYGLICFYRNLQRLFPEHVKAVDESCETNIKLLEHLSNHYGTFFLENYSHHNVLRLRCISFLYGKIIPEIEKQMGKIDYSTPELQINRVYYDRILAWLNHELSKEHYKIWAWNAMFFLSSTERNEIYNSLLKITPHLEKIIQREKKENYIIQLFSLDLTENIDTISIIGDLETLGQDESRVLALFLDFANSEEITNVAERRLISDIKHEALYEKMLQDVNSKHFTEKFGMKPFQMLMRMDFALYSQNHSLYKSQEIYLEGSDVQNIEEGTVMRWKYAMIFFLRAVEINLLENEKIDSTNTKLLAYLSDKDSSQNQRLSCVAFLCVHILGEIDERIQDKGVHLGDNPTQETYHEGIFELIYPEPTGNGPKQWPSEEQRDLGIDATFRDILNKIRALRVDAKDNNRFTKIGFGGLIMDLTEKIRLYLKHGDVQ